MLETLYNSTMKKKLLNMNQLGMLTNGLMKGLYPKPSKTELLVQNHYESNIDGCTLYFSPEYYQKLTSVMQGHIDNGSYSQSNANDDWLNLVNGVKSAEDCSASETNGLNPHFLAE